MARPARLEVQIVTDATKAQAGLSGFEKGLNKATVPAAAMVAGLLAFGKTAGDAASAAEQNMGAVDSVFKQSADTIHRWSERAAEEAGLSASAYEEMAAVIGAQLKNMGVPTEQLAGQTDELVKMGADLAAQFGGSTSDAVEALSSLLRGERDPIEKYGVSIKEADVQAQKAKMGLKGLTGEADKQATTMATMALLTAQTADAQGAFAREADTAAGAQQRANAEYEDTKSTLGSALLPLMAAFAGMLGSVARFAKDNATAFQILAVAIFAIASAVLVVNAALKVYRATLVVIQAVQAATWLTNPIFLVIIAVIALVAAIVLLWKRSETFRKIVTAVFGAMLGAVKAVFNWAKRNWPLLLSILLGPIGIAIALIIKNFGTVKTVLTAVAKAFITVWNIAFAAVKSYFNVWRTVASTVLGAVRAAISAVASFLGNAFARGIGALKSAFRSLTSVLTAPFRALESAINTVLGMIQSVINAIKKIKLPSIDLNPFKALNPFRAAPASVAGATSGLMRRGAAAPVASARASGGPVVIVNGALDPDAVARQIKRILAGHERRIGGRSAALGGTP